MKQTPNRIPLNLFSENLSESRLEPFTESGADGTKNYYFEGILAQADKLNRNGRVYPSDLLIPEIERYKESHVKRDLAWGELDHPDIAHMVSMQHVSHRIIDIRAEGSNIIGKAIIINGHPMGEIVKSCIDSGGQIAVSTRGVGKSVERRDGTEEMKVFYLTAIDVVSFPSGIDCFVRGIKEGVEILVESNLLDKSQAFKILKHEDKRISAREFSMALSQILKGT